MAPIASKTGLTTLVLRSANPFMKLSSSVLTCCLRSSTTRRFSSYRSSNFPSSRFRSVTTGVERRGDHPPAGSRQKKPNTRRVLGIAKNRETPPARRKRAVSATLCCARLSIGTVFKLALEIRAGLTYPSLACHPCRPCRGRRGRHPPSLPPTPPPHPPPQSPDPPPPT